MKLPLLIVICTGFVFIQCSSRKVVTEEDLVQTHKDHSPVQAPAAAPSAEAQSWQWSYQGDKGPMNWAKLNGEYAMCESGQQQSPINLIWSKPVTQNPLQIMYKEGDVVVSNTGYTFRLEFTPSSQVIFNGQEYLLEKAEIRTPSEHQLSGRSLPVEIQFYHRSPNGLRQAIISLFIIEGRESQWFNQVWGVATQTPLYSTSQTFRMNPDQLIPPGRTFYHYQGSLTHPPCLEGVDWFVLNTPLTLSRQQIAALRSVYDNNNRPLQKPNGRKPINY